MAKIGNVTCKLDFQAENLTKHTKYFLGGTTGAVILRRTNYRRRAVSLRDT
nr:MAG TPA: hypothetical protein [Caudoviricetes sp.]DAR60232.1 MAG TPA: hypothetical protein [Caudoviricetes sp.]